MSFRVEEAKKAFNGAAPNDDRHFINKRLQKPRRLNLKFVNNENKTNGSRYNSVLLISSKIFYCQLKQ
jgi:hypothetical protein